MNKFKINIAVVSLVLVSSSVMAADWIAAGRDLPKGRDLNWRLLVGSISEMEGMVQETTRQYYDAVGREEDQADAERYSLNDFGMDGGYETVGLSLDNAGNIFSFQMDIYLMNPEISTTARRNYYIGVDDVVYEGRSYENLMIPEGSEFSMEILGGVTEMRWLFTPFTIKPAPNVKITPLGCFGLFFFIGDYEIDAGESTGVTQYQEPPVDFVISGRADGMIGLGLPELGFGGEVRIGSEDGVNVVFQGAVASLDYEGNTAWMASSSDREKNIDLEHENGKFSCAVEFPMKKGKAWTLGAQYRFVESSAEITAASKTQAEIIANRERFDKNVTFKMETYVLSAGLTF